MSIKIKEVAFIYHPVTDVARARRFYEKLLGLKTGMEIEFAPGVWWIEYDIAGVALAVSERDARRGRGGRRRPRPRGRGPRRGAQHSVKAAGITLTVEPQEFTPCRMFAFLSPDGHSVTQHKRKA